MTLQQGRQIVPLYFSFPEAEDEITRTMLANAEHSALVMRLGDIMGKFLLFPART